LLGVHFATADRALRRSVQDEGEVERTKVNGTISPSYSPSVQERVIRQLANSSKAQVASRFIDMTLADFESAQSD
jgi:hypothetical protein